MRICVFCGSSIGALPGYRTAAEGFGALLAAEGIGLVYGGASVGLMGAAADAALAGGAEVIGVIPRSIAEHEIAHGGLTALHVVGSMHERKALMAELSDAFVALPGGIGTLEELFEVWTWAQLGLHRKPCGLLNVMGFFDGLSGFLRRVVADGFLRPEHHAMMMVDEKPGSLLRRMREYTPPEITKWIDTEET